LAQVLDLQIVDRDPERAQSRAMTPLAVWLQHLLPKHQLTVLAGAIASARAGRLTHSLIRWFVNRYGVDMAEAAQPDPAGYASFNDFFTRALRDGARPLASADWICPVDGAISQCGNIEHDRLFQAKGHHYTVDALLGGDARQAAQFVGGRFATLYLSPRDYHRIHMPCDARLIEMTHVPGTLYSVNPDTARAIAGLFARNERVVCRFDTAHGPMVMVLVGATIVGSMATVWHGTVNPPRPGRIRRWHYEQTPIDLKQGDEMGHFMLGSTVIMLWRAVDIAFAQGWEAGQSVRMGDAMATRIAF
jgi:phosphatidylserine decarboxylase